MKTILKVREIFWLVVAIAATVYAVIMSKKLGMAETWYLFIPPVIGAFMYTIARRQRIRNDKNNP